MRKTASTFCLLCCAIMFLSHAGAQMSQGIITIGGTASDYGNALIQTNDHGYAIAGQTFSYGDTANGAVYVIKLDSTGKVQWATAIGDTGVNTGNGIVQAKDGGYVIAGSTTEYGAGGMDVYVIKLNASGNVQWTKTYGGPEDDYANAVILSSDGGYAITGSTYSYGAGDGDMYVIKIDSAGRLQWTRTVGGPGFDVGNAIVQLADHSYAICGYTDSYLTAIHGPKNIDEYIVKLDSAGKLDWTRTYGYRNGLQYVNYATGIVYSTDNTLVVAGNSSIQMVGMDNGNITKFDTAGNIIWNKVMPCGGGSNNHIYDASIIQCKTDKSYIISTEILNYIENTGIMYLEKIDSSGNQVWYKGISDLSNSINVGETSITNTSDNGFALTGTVTSYSHGAFNVCLLKFDSLAATCLPDTLFGGTFDTLTLTLDTTGVALSGGSVTDSNVGIVIPGWLDSVVCPSFITTQVNKIEGPSSNVSVYPNPSTGIFQIQSSVADVERSRNISGQWSVEVYNVLGEQVKSEELRAKSCEIDISNQPNGVYLYRVVAGDGGVVGEGKVVVNH